MFGDFDLRLNASRGLSAELLVLRLLQAWFFLNAKLHPVSGDL